MKLKRPFQYFSPFQSPTSKWKTQLKRVFKKPPFWSDLNQMVKYPTCLAQPELSALQTDGHPLLICHLDIEMQVVN